MLTSVASRHSGRLRADHPHLPPPTRSQRCRSSLPWLFKLSGRESGCELLKRSVEDTSFGDDVDSPVSYELQYSVRLQPARTRAFNQGREIVLLARLLWMTQGIHLETVTSMFKETGCGLKEKT